ncbi:MAG: glycosyltransferase family 2 protein [Candidatus Melainabacteria bacterium]|nr:glycosyltransferase family 2 protein [Candidatus Melainabacteria bacterium]
MFSNQTICLLIPTLNEGEGLSKVLESVPNFVDRIMIVDSDSTDNTVKIAAKFRAEVINESRRGYGRALKTGFKNVKEDWVITLDADGTYPTSEIKGLLEYALKKDFKFLSASRMPLLNPSAMSHRNFLGNTFITWITNFLFKTKMVDGSSGMWLIHKSVLPFLNLKTDDWLLSNEIKIQAALNPGIGFHEMAIEFIPRIGETKVQHPWRIGLQLLFYIIWKRLCEFKN